MKASALSMPGIVVYALVGVGKSVALEELPEQLACQKHSRAVSDDRAEKAVVKRLKQ